jgi:hypothetical protein
VCSVIYYVIDSYFVTMNVTVTDTRRCVCVHVRSILRNLRGKRCQMRAHYYIMLVRVQSKVKKHTQTLYINIIGLAVNGSVFRHYCILYAIDSCGRDRVAVTDGRCVYVRACPCIRVTHRQSAGPVSIGGFIDSIVRRCCQRVCVVLHCVYIFPSIHPQSAHTTTHKGEKVLCV